MNTGNFMLENQDGNSTLTQPNPFDKQQLITESIVRNLIGGCVLPLHITENTANIGTVHILVQLKNS